ncbi:helix-turn-helix transcriptional regulator [Azospirillum picis]|uniref:AraC-like DNA-binding protein n=1 Tax=Azospirillum picis TaxID=488438 RepID=A0ABU0MVD2_9PROT|nr:AraC family transcriptional regulator [Azospirillum picis]MBP2303574.1 AraC-like DNA-binding protein [Azospirillum picis]MDQ0537422.1 AraC-like DNA-binding protein [Azospirillum picis]
MSKAMRIHQGAFGRVALLDMDNALIHHAHPHCHVLIKASGADTQFAVGEKLWPLRDDTAVLVNGWEAHSYAHRPGAPRTVILALYIEPRWLGAMQREFTASGNPGFFPQSCGELSPQIRRLADRMAAELLYDDPSGERMEQALFDLMIAIIDRFSDWRTLSGVRAGMPVASDFRIRQAVRFMRQTLGEEFEANRVAAAAGLSRAHMFRLFQQTLAITPALYFNVLRMEAAIDAMAASRESATEISGRLGFSAPSHFSRFFKNHQGVTPTEYRRVVTLLDGEKAGRA